jgi:hypothetical protein
MENNLRQGKWSSYFLFRCFGCMEGPWWGQKRRQSDRMKRAKRQDALKENG